MDIRKITRQPYQRNQPPLSSFLCLPALWPSTALDTASFWSLQVVARDPVFSVRLGSSRNSRAVGIWLLASDIDLLDGSSYALTPSLLLREVWDNPYVVEEVADTSSARKEEEVQEDASQC